MRRTRTGEAVQICSLASFILTVAGLAFAADDPQSRGQPKPTIGKLPVAERAGNRDATRLGERLSQDSRITDQRITDERYLPGEKSQVRNERRLKGEKYLPVEELRHQALEERPTVTTQEGTKKRKAETILQF